MSAEAFALSVWFERVCDCITCGVPVIATRDKASTVRSDKQSFYCINGHSMSYREGEIDRLKKQLAQKDRVIAERELTIRLRTESWESEQRTHRATKGQLTKLKNRVTNGVCPCCNRTFRNLQKHMATVHPERVEKGRDV